MTIRPIATGFVLVLLAAAPALAAPKGKAMSEGQLRAACWRELGYNPRTVTRTRGANALVPQVNDCVARKKAGR